MLVVDCILERTATGNCGFIETALAALTFTAALTFQVYWC